jgi:hypothetical protein
MTASIPWWWARAGGRRRYNAARQRTATERRRLVLAMLIDDVSQAEAARRLRVDRATICRDARWLGTLPDKVRDMPGGKWRITPRGWSFTWSFRA